MNEHRVSTMTVRFLAATANLGCCSPGGARHISAADAWADDAVARCLDLLFLQEVPSRDWLERFSSSYSVHIAEPVESHPKWCRSAVVVRRDAIASELLVLPTENYHGTYLAGAVLDLAGVGPVALVSVHASPNPSTDADKRRWSGQPPAERRGGGRNAGALWDVDFVVETLRLLACDQDVLAVGDFNESRRWDTTHPGETWGAEFFESVGTAGFVDCLERLWGEERATRGDHQIDHVLATPAVAERVTFAAVSEPSSVPGVEPSDHRPVEFEVAVV